MNDYEPPEIYGVKDWSHQEQLKHIMSVSAAYPPGTKTPFDWFGFWMYTFMVFAALGVLSAVVGISYLISG